MRDVQVALREHYNAVLNSGYKPTDVLGVFCYGSQNYNFAHEGSDVDSKAIIIPDYKTLCLGQPVSREIHMENGEHCEVKDIREIVKMFRKQNLNFIEILFTENCYINPDYADLWYLYFIQNAERIARMNPYQTVMSTCGQAIHTLKQNPGDGKKYANAYRLYLFLEAYLANKVTYLACMTFPNGELRNKMLALKKGELTISETETAILSEKFQVLKDSCQATPVDASVEDIFSKGIMELIAFRSGFKVPSE